MALAIGAPILSMPSMSSILLVLISLVTVRGIHDGGRYNKTRALNDLLLSWLAVLFGVVDPNERKEVAGELLTFVLLLTYY
jgi:hypothetical protein